VFVRRDTPYPLHLRLDQERLMVVRKQTYTLPPAEYWYVGSAFGSGGLASRVGRHLTVGPKRQQ
jgi:Uri superfamily endonuclease